MDNPSNTKKRKKLSPFLLIRLVGILLFIYILTTVDLASMWENLKGVKLNFLLYGILFQLLLLFLKAFRWHILNSGSKNTHLILRSLGEFFESYAIGVITPGRIGEIVKAGHAREKNKIMETGIRVLVERGFDLGFFVLLAGTAISLIFHDENTWFISVLFIFCGIFILTLAFIFMRSAKATFIIQKFLNRIPLLELNLDIAFHKRSGEVQLAVILLSVASNFSSFMSAYFLALGLLLDQGFLYISGAVAIAGLLNMLPVTVMGLGTREGTFLILFKPMAESLILAFSGLVLLVVQLGGGLISFFLGQLFLSMSTIKTPDK